MHITDPFFHSSCSSFFHYFNTILKMKEWNRYTKNVWDFRFHKISWSKRSIGVINYQLHLKYFLVHFQKAFMSISHVRTRQSVWQYSQYPYVKSTCRLWSSTPNLDNLCPCKTYKNIFNASLPCHIYFMRRVNSNLICNWANDPKSILRSNKKRRHNTYILKKKMNLCLQRGNIKNDSHLIISRAVVPSHMNCKFLLYACIFWGSDILNYTKLVVASMEMWVVP